MRVPRWSCLVGLSLSACASPDPPAWRSPICWSTRIRIAGVVPIADRDREAALKAAFLLAQRGQRVVLLDAEETSDGLRSGVVLLENHTFLNGRLLRPLAGRPLRQHQIDAGAI